jgi:hypothetical protein
LKQGFDTVAPNIDKDISSWAYDYAASRVDLIDNRALAVPCYEPGYTLVEKLQTISTKYRKQQETGQFPGSFLRHYYDVYCLLEQPDVQAFLGSDAYRAHKQKRFPKADNQEIGSIPLSAYPTQRRSHFTSAHTSGRRRSIIMTGPP